PADPRTGELVQMALRVAEKIEGGFGGGEPLALTDAAVTLTVTTAEGVVVAQGVPTIFEDGFYRVDYRFSGTGNYKLVFNATTKDNRSVSADFPVSVIRSDVNWTFFLVLLLLGLITFGIVAGVFYKARRDEDGKRNLRKIIPVAAMALLFFGFGAVALAYVSPPFESRALGNLQPTGEVPVDALT